MKLQWFPSNWSQAVSNSQQYKQAWNAISVPVVQAIFDNLFLNKEMLNLYNTDCLKTLKEMKAESIDCCVTDCPYKIIA